MRTNRICLLIIILALLPSRPDAQNPNNANYDESKAGSYTLPDPLATRDGRRVEKKSDWPARRQEILDLFAGRMYGRTPATKVKIALQERSREPRAFNGLATRREVTVLLTGKSDGPRMNLLLYVPNQRSGPAPVFLGMNFQGNHAVSSEPGIALSESWMRNDREGRVVDNRATEKARGAEASRWPLETILRAGYGVATIYYGDLYPDHPAGRAESIIPHLGAGSDAPRGDEWGALGAWAWGMSRGLDALTEQRDVDARRVILLGHSRLGKAALWAGAQDQRFAIVIANESGEGGAAIARRDFGETIERINTAFPHWFCANFREYNRRPEALPFDQHMLISLIAPRPVYVASAAEDLWADPRGEFLGAKGADPVYRLLGTDGFGGSEMPGVHQPITTTIGYHLRAGKHDVTPYDWEQYISFANRHLGGGLRRRPGR